LDKNMSAGSQQSSGEATGACAADAPVSAAATPHWVGPPTAEESDRTFYAAFEVAGQQYNLGKLHAWLWMHSLCYPLPPLYANHLLAYILAGDHVYLRPAQPGLPAFVAKLESLHQQREDGSKWAGVRWYYR
jgi:hypothetical protein